jgi:polysaccharide biosynthesis transport protein
MSNLLLPPARTTDIVPVEPTYGNIYQSQHYEWLLPRRTLSFWDILWRKKWTLLGLAFAGACLGLLIALVQPRLYQARATLEVQDLNDNFLNTKQVLPVNEVGLAGSFNDMQTQLKIVQSDTVLNAVIANMPGRETQQPSQRGSVLAKAESVLGFPSESPAFSERDARKIADTMKARSIGQTRVIELTADSADPRFAADFVNQLCSEFIDQNMKARWDMGQRTSQSLERLLEDSRTKLQKSEDALQSYARTSGLMFTSEKKSVADEKLSQIQDSLSKAQSDRIAAQSRYEMAKNSPPDALPDDLSQGLLREYQGKLTDLLQQRASLANTYTGDYGKIKRLDADIASLQNAIRAEQRSVVERTQNEYEAAARREKLLESTYSGQSTLVTDLDQRAVQYNILEREVEGNQQIYDEMLKEVKQASIASAVGTSNVRVLDAAQVPDRPYTPKPLLNCVLGFVIFPLAGILIGLARGHNDNSLREPGDGIQSLGLPEIGVLLHDASGLGLLHSPEDKAFVARSKRPTISDAVVFKPTSAVASQSASKEFVPHIIEFRPGLDDEAELAMESCRAVVTSLLSGFNGTYPRLLVITSPGTGEGKSTAVANIGLTLALLGRRVLLVDGDARRCCLHRYFGLHDGRGLTTILAGNGGPEQSYQSLIQKTSVPGLSVLASGPSSRKSLNLLYSPALARLLNQLKQEYDFVLIDTPPVFPIADARAFGRLADGVMLVARAGRTTRQAAGAAYRILMADNIRVLGMILNDWDPQSSLLSYYADCTRQYTDHFSH